MFVSVDVTVTVSASVLVTVVAPAPFNAILSVVASLPTKLKFAPPVVVLAF